MYMNVCTSTSVRFWFLYSNYLRLFLPKHVKERYDPMQVPGQSVLSSGFSVVVVVVVGGGVGRKNGGLLTTSFLGGAF